LFFGLGKISKYGKDSIRLRVESFQGLANVILPHFDKYPLITQKRADYLLFKQAVELINRQEHLTTEGGSATRNCKSQSGALSALCPRRFAACASLNNGLSDTLKDSFPNTKAVSRLEVPFSAIPDPHWLAGFTAGEGGFLINIKNLQLASLEFKFY